MKHLTMDADKYISEDAGFSSHLVLDNVSTEHNHDFYEIIYIVSGKIEHTIENVKSILETGDVIIISPNVKHSLLFIDSSSSRDIMISTALYDGFCNLVPQISELIKDNDGFFSMHLTIPELLEFENSVNNILSEIDVFHKRIKIISFLTNFFNKIYLSSQDIIVSENHIQEDTPPFIRKIIANMNKSNFLQSNISNLVKDTGYAHPYVCRVFKKYIGVSITDYYQKIRISHVAYYLKPTNSVILGIE